MKREGIILKAVLILVLCTLNSVYAAEADPRIRTQSAINSALTHSEKLYLQAKNIALDLQSQVNTLESEKKRLKEEVEQLKNRISVLETENKVLQGKCVPSTELKKIKAEIKAVKEVINQ